jgi:transcriptional regulator with XRE-family HTH domain
MHIRGLNSPLKKIELMRLGRRIRRARQLWGLSDTVLAAECGLDKDYYSQIESGHHDVLFSELCEICEVLRCDIAAMTQGIPRAIRC